MEDTLNSNVHRVQMFMGHQSLRSEHIFAKPLMLRKYNIIYEM